MDDRGIFGVRGVCLRTQVQAPCGGVSSTVLSSGMRHGETGTGDRWHIAAGKRRRIRTLPLEGDRSLRYIGSRRRVVGQETGLETIADLYEQIG